MGWVNLYKISYNPPSNEYIVKEMEDYRTKAKHSEDPKGKPWELPDGTLVTYIWSTNQNTAVLKANAMFDKYLRKPGGDE